MKVHFFTLFLGFRKNAYLGLRYWGSAGEDPKKIQDDEVDRIMENDHIAKTVYQNLLRILLRRLRKKIRNLTLCWWLVNDFDAKKVRSVFNKGFYQAEHNTKTQSVEISVIITCFSGKNYKEILLVGQGKNDHNIYSIGLDYRSEAFQEYGLKYDRTFKGWNLLEIDTI